MIQEKMKKNHLLELDHETVSDLIKSVDTEWDKNVLRVVLGSCRSKKEINKIGIDSHEIKKLTEYVVSVTQEKKSKYAATDMVKLRIQSQIETTDNDIRVKELSLRKKQYDWSQIQIYEINDEIDSLRIRRNELEKLKALATKYEKKRVKEMIRRTQYSLIREKRVGMRKKSMGRPLSMDEVDETFLLNCIESKTTAHGRRGDQEMYNGRRVKKRDFVKIVNYHRLQRNLRLIKSATIVYIRSKPHKTNSLQAKRHLGLSLFCTKKPPKTGDNDNELTHHQCSHKKNITDFHCHDRKNEETKFLLEIFMDDKAYLCPSTSTGMCGARNQRIFQPTDDSISRKLPKYDFFPVGMVNVTPSTYRIMTKQVKQIHDTQETEILTDACYCFVRPKYFLGSPGSV